jgi:hypothetical protein
MESQKTADWLLENDISVLRAIVAHNEQVSQSRG